MPSSLPVECKGPEDGLRKHSPVQKSDPRLGFQFARLFDLCHLFVPPVRAIISSSRYQLAPKSGIPVAASASDCGTKDPGNKHKKRGPGCN